MTTGNGASAEPKISDRSVKSLMRKRLNEFQADVLEYLACRLSGLGLILWRRASRFRQGFLNPAHEGFEPRRAITMARADEGLPEILPTFRLDLFARAPAEADFSWETTDLSPWGL